MPDFRIYYDGGYTYAGKPEIAPAFGVLVIVERSKNFGRILHSNKDYFVWLGKRWLCVDYIGLLDYLAQPGWKKVLFGRMVDDDYYNEVMKVALEDKDFPIKTAKANWER